MSKSLLEYCQLEERVRGKKKRVDEQLGGPKYRESRRENIMQSMMQDAHKATPTLLELFSSVVVQVLGTRVPRRVNTKSASKVSVISTSTTYKQNPPATN